MNIPLSHESPLLIKALSSGPVLMGLLSKRGECVFLSGALECASHHSSDSPEPRYLRHIFPFISESDAFWEEKLSIISNEGRTIQFEHVLGDSKVLVVLFSCALEEVDEDTFLGLVALELSAHQDSDLARIPTPSVAERMIAIVGHELRNPLSALGAAIRILEMRPSSSSVETVLSMMRRQVDIATRLVNDLLDTTSITAKDGLPLIMKEELLSEVIKLSLDGFQYRMPSKEHSISVSSPEAPVKIRCDLVRLSQAITNLLHNSSKYTPEGGHISLRVACDECGTTITVSDNGVGIPTEKLDTIFDAFEQIRDSSAQFDGGVGLGLFLVKAIAEGHGGKVAAASAGRGQGSAFSISIPNSAR